MKKNIPDMDTFFDEHTDLKCHTCNLTYTSVSSYIIHLKK